ncbi:hypothetical protein PAXINDRAFT_11922 [Paxillus involutus ATCC 200175]|uniref:Uncharacterized protein n=1 Tax=Paxillus involutus ATCC 200175 TaxID=664439 RepID=A0A0C9TYI5_PAXIN|nr:hypothetical protein PAXINDRAFT_11922 [Paxillus involutus ATCC 200175]
MSASSAPQPPLSESGSTPSLYHSQSSSTASPHSGLSHLEVSHSEPTDSSGSGFPALNPASGVETDLDEVFDRILTKHERGCVKGKKRLSGALSKAKEAYQRKKLHRDLEEAQTRSEGDTVPQLGQPETGNPPAHSDDHRDIVPNPKQPVPSTCRSPVPEDDTLSLAQRRPHWLNHRLPLRFRDMLPNGPLPLPPPGIELPEGLPQGSSESHIPRSPSPPPSVVRRTFKTQHNKFGLFCMFNSKGLPSHDPDEHSSSPSS